MVEFVSYSGRYPNLCAGTLMLCIDGQNVVLEDALISGGMVSFEDGYADYIEYGPWSVNVPDEYKDVSNEISRCVNENVEWGCCGGCV